jgi:hypothetical protein
VPYTGAIQNPCSATVAGAALSQAVAVVYSPPTVRESGAYTASATFPGDANHAASSGGPAAFTIAKLPATATAGSGTMSYGGTVPMLPCTVRGLLATDAGSVTCTTSVSSPIVAGANATAPVVSPSAPPDYSVTTVNGALTALYVQSGCFASPLYSSQPPTKSYQKAGSSLPVKCVLLTATGASVTNATGNLLVQDRGTDGLAIPATVFSRSNVFNIDSNKNYNYGLDTGLPGFVSGHYYVVTAFWNDGSTTTGWFYIK